MTPARLAALVRYYTGTNSTTFTDADILMLANVAKDDIASALQQRDEDYFGMEFTADLVAGQREYPLPDEVLNAIKRVEAKLDGTGWSKLSEFDLVGHSRPTDEDGIRESFSGLAPQFDLFRRSLVIYSGDAVIGVAGGLKLWAIVYPADLADLTGTVDMSVDPTPTTHGIPRQVHELIARRVSIAYKSSRDKPLPLSEKELKYDSDLETALEELSGANLDRVVSARLPETVGRTGASMSGHDY